jgi:hypothetical protein
LKYGRKSPIKEGLRSNNRPYNKKGMPTSMYQLPIPYSGSFEEKQSNQIFGNN